MGRYIHVGFTQIIQFATSCFHQYFFTCQNWKKFWQSSASSCKFRHPFQLMIMLWVRDNQLDITDHKKTNFKFGVNRLGILSSVHSHPGVRCLVTKYVGAKHSLVSGCGCLLKTVTGWSRIEIEQNQVLQQICILTISCYDCDTVTLWVVNHRAAVCDNLRFGGETRKGLSYQLVSTQLGDVMTGNQCFSNSECHPSTNEAQEKKHLKHKTVNGSVNGVIRTNIGFATLTQDHTNLKFCEARLQVPWFECYQSFKLPFRFCASFWSTT
jgi:hypothetical protein